MRGCSRAVWVLLALGCSKPSATSPKPRDDAALPIARGWTIVVSDGGIVTPHTTDQGNIFFKVTAPGLELQLMFLDRDQAGTLGSYMTAIKQGDPTAVVLSSMDDGAPGWQFLVREEGRTYGYVFRQNEEEGILCRFEVSGGSIATASPRPLAACRSIAHPHLGASPTAARPDEAQPKPLLD